MYPIKFFTIIGMVGVAYCQAIIQSTQETEEISHHIALVNKLWDNGDDYFLSHSSEFFADKVHVHLTHLNNEGVDLDLATITKQEAERAATIPGKWEVLSGFAFDDKIVAYCRCTGVHKGEFNGLPSTNKPFVFYGMIMFRFKEGKVCEVWSSWDRMALYKQLVN